MTEMPKIRLRRRQMSALKAHDRQERDVLEAILKAIRAEWGFARTFGLPELVRRWKSFVLEVENGHELSIHDYTHDLAMRDLLQQVKSQVPQRLAEEIRTQIEEWDARYHQVTRPSERPIAEPLEEPAGGWWFRIPVHSGKELSQYLATKVLNESLRSALMNKTEEKPKDSIGLEIIPGTGLGPIRFGMSVNQVEEIIGRAEEAFLYDENTDRTLSLAYQRGAHLSFRQSEDFRLLAIEVESYYPCRLFGVSIASLSMKQSLSVLQANLTPSDWSALNEVRHDDLEEISLTSDRLGMTLYFDLNMTLQSVNWGVLFDPDDGIIWPSD